MIPVTLRCTTLFLFPNHFLARNFTKTDPHSMGEMKTDHTDKQNN